MSLVPMVNPMLLDAELAQQIIDKTQGILDANINVMDTRGVIIASGDRSRLGQLHDGAVLALKRQQQVVITVDDQKTLQGVKPGINALLKCHAETVGVLGVTGDPARIRQYVALVKMAAEMLVEQAAFMDRLQWDKRHKEGFILAWIQRELSEEQLQSWAVRLGINIHEPRVAVLIELGKASPMSNLSDMQQVIELLEFPSRDNLVAMVSTRQLVVLKPCSAPRGGQPWGERESQRIDVLMERLKDRGIGQVKVALGQFFPDPALLPLSFESACQVMQTGKLQNPESSKYLFDELRLPVLLAPLADKWQGAQLKKAIEALRKQDTSGKLLKTLHALYLHQGSLTQCAQALHVHRNTLRYRLNRIHDITGISPHHFTGLVELYLGIQLQVSGGEG